MTMNTKCKLIVKINGKKAVVSSVENFIDLMRRNGWKKCPLAESITKSYGHLEVYLIDK